MSNSCLIQWFEQLLFGSSVSTAPPPALRPLLVRMEVEGIPWSHMMTQGGLTAFSYQIHGDLNFLLDYLEKQWFDEAPSYSIPLKTQAVTLFWNQLQVLLARKEQLTLPVLPVPSEKDDAILKHLLESNHPGPYSFQSAEFWGKIAQKCINLHRSEIPNVSFQPSQRVQQLYDLYCFARGQLYDPLTLQLVHHAEYVNAVHWQSVPNLEAFMQDQPSHSLTLSIQALLKQTVDQVLRGEKPNVLCSQLDAFLHNIRVIHASVQQVPHDNTPPKVIDVFQRLLVLCHRDGLWEKEVSLMTPTHSLMGTALFHVTEQLRMAEREKRILWTYVTEHDEESAVKPQQHICSKNVYANHKLHSLFR